MDDRHAEIPVILGRYAGVFSRLVAFLLDRLIAFGIAFLLLLVVQYFATLLRLDHWIESLTQQATVNVILVLLFLTFATYVLTSVVYDIVFWLLAGQTPGKRMLGLRILRTDGKRLRFGNALRRELGYLVSYIFVLGFIWILFDNRRQGFHDKLGGTIVVYSWPEGRLRGTFLITYLERFSGRNLGT